MGVSTFATAPLVGGSTPAPRPILGNDVQNQEVTVPVIAGGASTTLTGNIAFPNIGPFTPNLQDQVLFHVYLVHTDIPPTGVVVAGHKLTAKAFQAFRGPSVYPDEGGPSITLPAGGGLAPGVTYQSFSCDFSLRMTNTLGGNSAGGTIQVSIGCHIVNATG